MTKLNLGCGRKTRKGWINIDINQGKNVQLVHNLNNIPYPFKDNTVKEIYARAVVEHLHILPDEFVTECYRILVKGGKLKFSMPYSTSVNRDISPQHSGRASLYETFDVYTKQHFPHDFVKFRKIKKVLLFPKGLHLHNYLIEPLLNKFPQLIKIYEHTPLKYLVSAEGLIITLIK